MDQSEARTPPLRRWINQRDLARRWNLTTGALKRRRARGLPPRQWWPFSGTCILYDLNEIEAIETEGLKLRRPPKSNYEEHFGRIAGDNVGTTRRTERESDS